MRVKKCMKCAMEVDFKPIVDSHIKNVKFYETLCHEIMSVVTKQNFWWYAIDHAYNLYNRGANEKAWITCTIINSAVLDFDVTYPSFVMLMNLMV